MPRGTETPDKELKSLPGLPNVFHVFHVYLHGLQINRRVLIAGSGVTVTSAEAAYARFKELAWFNPADLSKHLDKLRRHDVKITISGYRLATRNAPGQRVLLLDFPDGSALRIEMTKKYRQTYLWADCRIMPDQKS